MTMTRNAVSVLFLALCIQLPLNTLSYVTLLPASKTGKIVLKMSSNPSEESGCNTPSSRRRFLLLGQTPISFLVTNLALNTIASGPSASAAVTRAVGSSEQRCREDGNCLETGEWDGAVGWSWGGKDRCDATDPRCSTDGRLRDTLLQGDQVPDKNGFEISHVIQMELRVGKSESGVLLFGLYGKSCPNLTKQLVDFLTNNIGLSTTSRLIFEDGYGVSSAPLTLAAGGALNTIYPGERLDFGIASQSASYAKRKGSSKAPADFVPQPRPTKELQAIRSELSPRYHDAAGLISVPKDGLGYGGTGFESDDEAFASAFQITACPMPSIDKRESRKVIGQILDQTSMAFLSRLSSLPTQKGFKGIIPGQNYGPPLVRVTVKNVTVTFQSYATT